MYNYAKKLLLILSILIMPSMNMASKAMENETYNNTKHTTKARPSVRPEDSTTSWTPAHGTSMARSVGTLMACGLLILSHLMLTAATGGPTPAPWIPCVCECKYPNGTAHYYDVEWKFNR